MDALTGRVIQKETVSPFGLQISRSKANIQAFNTTAAKVRSEQQNTIYNMPVSIGANRGYLT